MTYAEQLRSDYAAVRARLFNPPHAVPDADQFRVAQDCRAPLDEGESMLKGGKKAIEARARCAKYKQHRNLLEQKWLTIANEVAEKHNVPLALIRSSTRKTDIALARQELYYRLLNELGLSNWQVGHLLKRDGSSVSVGAAKWARVNGL